MEIASSFAGDFSFLQFLVALVVSGLCLVCALFAVRFSPASFGRKSRSVESDGGGSGGSLRKACSCACLCRSAESGPATATAAAAAYLNGGAEEMLDRALVVSERQTGASMMEQLVPEITTHALSYLDYPSLCRLSMTNSLMRKAANDDNAWKALYHKCDTNQWMEGLLCSYKSHCEYQCEFFNIIRERSITSMSRLWFNADYVKCVHASGELFTGYNAVIESWQLAFNWDQGVDFQVRDVRARVLTDMAWVTMKTFVDMETGPFNVTNVFEFHNGRWFMVHHHSSVLIDGEVDQQIVNG
ncbi:hypothetical protein AAG906_034092 [Vitis piasezkii]